MAGIPVPVKRRSLSISSEEVENRDDYLPSSRYKDAKYFQRKVPGVGQRLEPETWTPPAIAPSDQDLFTKVKSGEVGRLDLIALRVYRLSSLWWVIAYANDIIDPFEEVTVDRILRYPPFDLVATRVLA